MTGALAAGRRRMDTFGVIIIATATALGGGSVRDILLGHSPAGLGKTSGIRHYRRRRGSVNDHCCAGHAPHLRRLFLVPDAPASGGILRLSARKSRWIWEKDW